MTEHKFDPLTQFCLGCTRAASEVANGSDSAECEAIWRTIGEVGQFEVCLTPGEELVIFSGAGDARVEVTFTTRAMFDLRDFVDEATREMRER